MKRSRRTVIALGWAAAAQLTAPAYAVESTAPLGILAQARAGSFDALKDRPDEVARAIEALVAERRIGDALELYSRSWRICWFGRGELETAARLAAIVLAPRTPADAVRWRTRTLCADGIVAFRQGQNARSRKDNDQALILAQRDHDLVGECEALTGLARLALRSGDYARVVRLSARARARAQAAHDMDAEAPPLHLLAAGTRMSGDLKGGLALYLESLELNRRRGNRAWVVNEEHNLGWVEIHLGDTNAAAEWFHKRDADDDQPDAYGEAWRDLNWAAVALLRGDNAEARRRFDAGDATLHRSKINLDPDDAAEFQWLQAKMKELAS